MTDRIVLWGASGHARVVADIVRASGAYEIAGFFEDREQLPALRASGVTHLIVAFGNCEARVEAARDAVANGFTLATAIHPSAVISPTARIGSGTVVAANAVINPAAMVGENVIVNTSSSIDHDCVIGDGAHICPGVRLAGGVRVGELTWVGIGAVVADGRTIGRKTMIGAGAVVISDIPDEVVAYGVPARVVRKNV